MKEPKGSNLKYEILCAFILILTLYAIVLKGEIDTSVRLLGVEKISHLGPRHVRLSIYPFYLSCPFLSAKHKCIYMYICTSSSHP
jgi:hypothetical protein